MQGYGEAELHKSGSYSSGIELSERPDVEDPFAKGKVGLNEKTSLINNDIGDAETRMTPMLITIIVVVSIGSSLQFGYGTGVMNNSEEFIREVFMSAGKSFSIMQWGITVSCYGAGGLLGSVIGPKVFGAFCGRKATLLLTNFFVFLSSYLIAFASVWWVMAIGRISIGIVAGVATAVVPTYFSEISPVALRGGIGTMHQLGITVGILISQFLSTPSLHMFGSTENWQWLFLVPCLASLIELIVLPFCPESPSYLYQKEGKEAAAAALGKLIDPRLVNTYVGYIEEEVRAQADSSEDSLTIGALFQSMDLRKQLVVGIVVQLMMQFSGIDAVFYYSTTVFIKADVPDPELATTFLGFLNVLITIWAVKYMDVTGRRTLLMASWVGMFISYVLITFSFVMKETLPGMDTLSIVALTGVICNFAYGPGCIAWFIIAEIFPLYARDSAMAIGIFINWVANWLIAFSFPILLEIFTVWTFLIFMGTTGFFYWFTYNFVPETKGRTVAEITELFKVMF